MKQISVIHQSAENHQGQELLNAPRKIGYDKTDNVPKKEANL